MIDVFLVVFMLLITLALYFLISKEAVQNLNGSIIEKTIKRQNMLPKYIFAVTIFAASILIFSFRFIGTKNGVPYGGIDAQAYRSRFDAATGDIFSAIAGQDNEWGYGFFVFFIRLFTSDFQVFLGVYYCILFILAVRATKSLKFRNDNKVLTILLLFCFVVQPIIMSMNLMRNVLAYFIVFDAYRLLCKKKFLFSILVTLLAMSIHMSAIIFLFVIFVNFILKNKRRSLSEYILFFLLFIALGYVLFLIAKSFMSGTKYEIYFYVEEGMAFASGLFVQRIMILVSLFCAYGRNKIKAKDYYAFLLFFSGFLVFVIQPFFSVAYRMHEYINIAIIYLLQNIYSPNSSESSIYRREPIIALMIKAVALFIPFYMIVFSFFMESIPASGLYFLF